MRPWEWHTFADLVEVRKKTVHPENFGDREVQHYSLPAYDSGAVPAIAPASSIRSAKLLIEQPSVLLSKLNPHIPRVWSVEPSDGSPALASTEFLVLVPRSGVELGYLYALCSSRPFQRRLASLVTGTSTSHQRVKVQDILELRIPLAPLEEQRRIGELLRAISLRRLAADRVVELTTSLIAAAFSEAFPEVSGGGGLLEEAVEVTSGVSYRSDELGGQGQALVTLKSFARSGEYQSRGLKPWTGVPRPKQAVRPGDIVVAQTDLTQAADVLGAATLVRRSPRYERLAVSLDVAVVRPREGYSREFLLGLLKQPAFQAHCRARANGTTVLHLPRRSIENFPVNLPPLSEVEKFSQSIRPMLARQLTVDDEQAQLMRISADAVGDFFAAAYE